MLTYFEVKNFKNFGKAIKFNLGQTNGYEFNPQCVANGVIKKAIIYGYNGAGKSNLGFALFDLVSHVTDRQKGAHLYENYLYAGAECNMAIFKYHFSLKNGTVVYEYGKSDLDTLIFERLFINEKEFASVDRRVSTTATINAEGAETLKRDVGETLISIIAYIKNNSILEDNQDNACFDEFIAFVNGMLFFRSLEKNAYIGLEQGINWIESDIVERGNAKNFEKFLNEAGIKCKLSIVKGDKRKNLAFDFGGKKILFSEIASQGTRSLTLFYYWYQRLTSDDSKATFLFIDEFDSFYHYSLSILIIKMLRDIKAQVVVTTHNTSVMTNDLLRPDCYFFLDSNGIRSLSNSTEKELREAHNIEKMYRAGAFSG